MTETIQCQCPCGETTFTVTEQPTMRLFCHCTICQEFNQAPFADICITSASNVSLDEAANVNYRSYAKPAIVQRGKCASCNQPAIEFIESPLGKIMAIIPSKNFPDNHVLPQPSFHGFYNRRREDAADDLPKYSGYWPSQWGFSKHYIKAKMDK